MPKRIARTQRNQARKLEKARRQIVKNYLGGFERKRLNPELINHAMEQAEKLKQNKAANSPRLRVATSKSRLDTQLAIVRHLDEAHKDRPLARYLQRTQTELDEIMRNRYGQSRGLKKKDTRMIEDQTRMQKRGFEARQREIDRIRRIAKNN